MKTIILNRHAKSDWSDSEEDFDRPLSNRGIKEAELMSDNFINKKINVDKIISSPAMRAITTARAFANKIGISQNYNQNYNQSDNQSEIQEEEMIYHSGSQYLRENVENWDNSLETVLLFGHNPDFTSMAVYYTGDRGISMMPCSIVCIDFKIDKWSDIDKANGEIRFYENPNMIEKSADNK